MTSALLLSPEPLIGKVSDQAVKYLELTQEHGQIAKNAEQEANPANSTCRAWSGIL